MMNLPSLSTIRECRFDTLPFGKMMSLPCTRPIVTSGLSNSRRFCSPPFSLTTIANIQRVSSLRGRRQKPLKLYETFRQPVKESFTEESRQLVAEDDPHRQAGDQNQ